jgi:opacity protein-like surface antigen
MDVLRFPQGRLTCAVDALRPSDNSETINAGCELSLLESVSLRAGYKSLFRDDSEEGLTLGAGLKVRYSPTSSLCLDYTFADFGLFDYVQMFSMGICF